MCHVPCAVAYMSCMHVRVKVWAKGLSPSSRSGGYVLYHLVVQDRYRCAGEWEEEGQRCAASRIRVTPLPEDFFFESITRVWTGFTDGVRSLPGLRYPTVVEMGHCSTGEVRQATNFQSRRARSAEGTRAGSEKPPPRTREQSG